MKATAWRGGNGGTYGIRVGLANRDEFFDSRWEHIDVEIDGTLHRFALTGGFWRHCPEFRDRGQPIIRNWLRRHGRLNWPKGRPPEFELVPLGTARFRLLASRG